eukprot:1626837-Amphidinium_carterae.1
MVVRDPDTQPARGVLRRTAKQRVRVAGALAARTCNTQHSCSHLAFARTGMPLLPFQLDTGLVRVQHQTPMVSSIAMFRSLVGAA